MIKVSVLYANESGKSFDMDYYCNSHIPMVLEKVGAACSKAEVDQGLAGGAPDAPAAYIAMGHLYFDSVESFQTAFGPHAEAIMADVPNYTDIQPNIQISEVKS
ncbi:MAG: EthD family reductase [Alphaproteobacteria bacterium]|nr:EthD family reductase [Alphaproteobacteria bacterium]MBL6954020.1 EthD family reductase [Alphaproteobacteria bacterium]